MAQHLPVKIGLSQRFDCSYLAHEEEQLLVILDPVCYTPANFEALLSKGFRRSGEQIYRPHCPSCTACKSVRILTEQFTPSRSQKRKLNKCTSLRVVISDYEKPEYYPLYAKYISMRHQDGTMYPPNEQQYQSFLLCSWMTTEFIELWDADKLVAVAVTDVMPDSLSAIYSFFDPDYEHLSLGTVLILKQLEYAQQSGRSLLYLGYQVDGCRKMMYKLQFNASEQLIGEHWHTV